MARTLLESLTAKQLVVFTCVLVLAMSAFFIIGGTKGADPATANIHISNVFVPDSKGYKFDNPSDWVWYNHDSEFLKKNGYFDKKIHDLFFVEDINSPDQVNRQITDAAQIILATKFPHPGSFKMHKAYQFMLVVMTVQMEFMKNFVDVSEFIPKGVEECVLEFNAKLGYSDEDTEKPTKWKQLSIVKGQKRPFSCKFSSLQGHDGHHDGYYTCDDQHLFELGSVAHKHYILNLQFPSSDTNKHCLAKNTSFFSEVHLTEIHQNGGYTISLFVSKTVMFPFIVGALLFFLQRIRRENREKVLLEKALMFLGMALVILILPIDWFTLVIDMPFMLLFSDLRQGLFYASLLIFWSIFAGEHILDQQERNKLSSYKYEVGCISVGCISLFIFDCVERGMQLSNPFHTIWKKDAGEKAARAFLGLAAAAAVIFCLFFMRLLYHVYTNIRMKEVALPAMQEDRRRYYENRIYRFRVLIWVTLFTLLATVVCFILNQMNETMWKFEDASVNDYVLVSSAMHFGMFGMWGTYVFALLILYAPSGGGVGGPSVEYRRSEHLLHAGDGSVDASSINGEDDDEVSFRHPKT